MIIIIVNNNAINHVTTPLHTCGGCCVSLALSLLVPAANGAASCLSSVERDDVPKERNGSLEARASCHYNPCSN